MAENQATKSVRKVPFAQSYIKEKYSDTIGLATSILGQVLLGTLKSSKRKKEVIKLCLKDMKNEFSDRVAEDPRREIEFMHAICNRNHPHFVRFIDAVEDNKLYCICLEYVIGGDMCTYIQNIGSGINASRAKKYAIQLTKACYFMHQSGYAHLDLSLENVLWDKRTDVLKICDFGLSRKFPNGDINEYFAAATIRPGKKGYMAPEIYAYQKFNGEKADIFSLGVIIFILLTGFPPFNTPNASDKCFQFMYYGKLEWLLKQWKLNDIIDAQCRDLLSKIFCHPKKRITVAEMLSHPWLDQCVKDVEAEMSKYENDTVAVANANANAVRLRSEDRQSPSPSPPQSQSPSPSPSPPRSERVIVNVNVNEKKTRKSTVLVKKKRKSISKQLTRKSVVKKVKTNHSHSHRSKSIQLSISESSTLLSRFAGAATATSSATAVGSTANVDSDTNCRKKRSKSLCYSYDNNNKKFTKFNEYHINNKSMNINTQNATITPQSEPQSNVTQKINDKKHVKNETNVLHTNANNVNLNENKPHVREAASIRSERSHSNSHSHSSDDHKKEDSHDGHAQAQLAHAQIANLRQHLNETQLLTQQYMNNNGNFTPNAQVNDNNIFDDRKEGDYETCGVYPNSYAQERRPSVNSQDAGSIHSDQHSLKHDDDESHNNNNNNNNNAPFPLDPNIDDKNDNIDNNNHPPV